MKKMILIAVLTLLIFLISGCGNQISGNVVATDNNSQVINMVVTRSGYSPDEFVLKKGVPVRWIIDGKEITGCNNAIKVPKLNLKFDIKKGQQTIEFTPTEEGVIPWSCWMGMIQGKFIVRDNINLNNVAEVKKELDAVPNPVAGSCGVGKSGGCGCGG